MGVRLISFLGRGQIDWFFQFGFILNVSAESIQSGQGLMNFNSQSILINAAFGAIGDRYSSFISNSTGVSNAVGDALASPFIVGGSVIDGKVNQ